MGSLLTQKKAKRGAIEKYKVPHSPFQKLIDGKRKERGLSLRDLAGEVEGLNQGTLWIWLHTANGCPHPKSCTPTRLAAISHALDIPLNDLQTAWDASRLRYGPQETPTPPALIDALGQLIAILEQDQRQYIKKETVLNLAKRLRAGAKAE